VCAIQQDQFDVIDFSDNDIKKLNNFPLMPRLNALILNNNSVTRVGVDLGDNLPKLSTIILTNNKIANISEVLHLASVKRLESLSLLGNPVSLKAHYRQFVIVKIPSVKWLDYRKVTQTERDEAAKFFKSAPGVAFLTAVVQEQKLIAEGGAAAGGGAVALTAEQKVLVKLAIERATTKEEIDNIERQLKVRTFDKGLDCDAKRVVFNLIVCVFFLNTLWFCGGFLFTGWKL
jgi:U2 small nuclear ribonucleoprotein A'